jgi:uroporphyrinogen decarboxylase
MTALAHREPDRVPVELGSTWNSTLTLSGHQALERYFGEKFDGYSIMRWLDTLVFPDEQLLRKFHVDCRSIYSGGDGQRDMESLYRQAGVVELEDGALGQFGPDGRLIWKKPAQSCEFQQVGFPLGGRLERERVDRHFEIGPDESFKREAKEHGEKARRLRESTDYALIQSNFIAMVVTAMQEALGFEDWYVSLALSTDELLYATEKYLDKMLHLYDIYFAEIGPYIDVTECLGDDMADQRGLCFSLDQYVKIFKPMHRKIIQAVKKHTGAKIMFHICGAAYPFIPHLIDIGVDVINPVQLTAANMDAASLKREFGKDISFWGGLDTQNLLPFGTKEQVAEEARRIIELLGKDGGYIFAPCHDIQRETPVENIAAMYAAAAGEPI